MDEATGLVFWRLHSRSKKEVWVTAEKFHLMLIKNRESVEKFLADKPEYQREKMKRYWRDKPEIMRKRARDRRKKRPWVYRECDKRKRIKHGDKLRSRCRLYRESNRDEINKKRRDQWAGPERDRLRAERRALYLIQKERGTLWYKNNRDKYLASTRASRKLRRDTNPLVKLACNYRCAVYNALRGIGKRKRRRSSLDYLGCTIPELKIHLEKAFLPGMTWDNWGLKTWNIDHRTPIASAKTIEELEALFHFSNLQPLWWIDNIRKSDKLPHELTPIPALTSTEPVATLGHG